MLDLSGNICLVTGASRGIGRGIASQLAYYGATCYVTARNFKSLESLSSEVEGLGGSGRCIAVQCDHEDDEAVEQLFRRIDEENDGKLDLLVNNAYPATEFLLENQAKDFWELSLNSWDVVNNVGLRNHYLCAVHASKLMVEKKKGLIINVSSAGGVTYIFSPLYGIGKSAKDRMARDCALELKKFNVAFVTLWPGLVRTEKIKNSLDKGELDQLADLYKRAETTIYVGRTVAALLSEPHEMLMSKSGKILLTTDIGRAHGICDEYGIAPQDQLQLNVILQIYGYPRLARYIPDFVKIPFSFLLMSDAWKRC